MCLSLVTNNSEVLKFFSGLVLEVQTTIQTLNKFLKTFKSSLKNKTKGQRPVSMWSISTQNQVNSFLYSSVLIMCHMMLLACKGNIVASSIRTTNKEQINKKLELSHFLNT